MSFFTPEVITGLMSLAGGALAGIVANMQKTLVTSIDAIVAANKQGNNNSNDAAKRAGRSFLQPAVGLIIIAVAFLSLYLVAVQEIPVSYIYEQGRSKFLGLFGSNDPTIKVIQASGFVIPPYVKYSVISVVNFLFGASVVKLRRI